MLLSKWRHLDVLLCTSSTLLKELRSRDNISHIKIPFRLLSSPGAVNVFDRNAKRIQKNRACTVDNPGLYDYLKDAVADQVVDRVCDVARFVI